MIQMIQISIRGHQKVVNKAVVIAVTDTLVKRYPEQEPGQTFTHLYGIYMKNRTTGKVEIPEGKRREAKSTFLTAIVNKVEEFQIPPPKILNIGQINSKYVFMDKAIMVKKDSTSVSIAGLSDDRSIDVTFTSTLNVIFLLYNLFLVEKQFKVHLGLIFLKVSPFLQILNTAVTLPNL